MKKILMLESDHRYREVFITTKKVVFNRKENVYFEYFGDEYLEDNEVVVELEVVE